jgi:hypothetical protein
MLAHHKLIKGLLAGCLITLLFLNGCTYPKCSTPPESFRIRLVSKKDSTDLISNGFYSKDSIKIWYVKQNLVTMIPCQIITDSIHKSIISSSDIAWISAEGNRDFYIQLNKSDIDTVYLKVDKLDDKCASYQYSSFKYNGQEIQMDQKEYDYIVRK